MTSHRNVAGHRDLTDRAAPPTKIPAERLRLLHEAAPEESGIYVLYWMTASRRTFWNYALQRAADWARHLGKPLVVCEPLLLDSAWACDRAHRFVLEGMMDSARRLGFAGVHHYPFVETELGAGAGLLAGLLRRACVGVVDRHPPDSVPQGGPAGADNEIAECACRVEEVDSSGVVPLAATGTAPRGLPEFRRFLHERFRGHLSDFPERNPLAKFHEMVLEALPPAISTRWPRASGLLLAGDPGELARLPLDHSVAPIGPRGGSTTAQAVWRELLDRLVASGPDRPADPSTDRPADPLADRDADRHTHRPMDRPADELEDPPAKRPSSPTSNWPEKRPSSPPSNPAPALAADPAPEAFVLPVVPHLRFGHISVHQILAETLRRCRWTPDRLPGGAEGNPRGFWGLSPRVEAFLDEALVLREFRFHGASRAPDNATDPFVFHEFFRGIGRHL